jgi:hypothetical protein
MQKRQNEDYSDFVHHNIKSTILKYFTGKILFVIGSLYMKFIKIIIRLFKTLPPL